ncbi:MAG TPA: GNAT family N-acetyltransferase [Thermodesulfobacteriota bacterium]|nr:GNAT family N-acetyltransferase [Thermodesulfobacteriota bacterium]
MPNIKIREAVTGDAVRMAEILREIGWSERRNALPLEDVSGPIEKLIEHTGRDKEGHTIIVATDDDDKVVGFLNVHWVPFIMLGSLEGYVSDVFVSPSSGGMGVGKALVERVIDEGAKRGCMRLMLTNGKEKLSYKTGFYKKLGWTERPSVANFVYYYREPWS